MAYGGGVKKKVIKNRESDFQETSDVRPPLAASYHVRCKLDGGHYLAIFATSEMDKVRRRQGRGWWVL